jgi:hypothetical protein
MVRNFPLEGVSVEFCHEELEKPSSAVIIHPWYEVGEEEFFLDIINVAKYSATKGKSVRVRPYPEADPESVHLFLAGSVLGAILHQQQILPLHGSSFRYNDKGVVICGRSGVGKSSVTAAFCQQDASFINDDITPVRITSHSASIVPIKTSIKLWDDSFQQLGIEHGGLQKIRPMLEKYYLPFERANTGEQPLHHIIILDTHSKDCFQVTELSGMDKYNALRKQIYRKAYLKGMPVTEREYFKQLLNLTATVSITQVVRPQLSNIFETKDFVKNNVLR